MYYCIGRKSTDLNPQKQTASFISFDSSLAKLCEQQIDKCYFRILLTRAIIPLLFIKIVNSTSYNVRFRAIMFNKIIFYLFI